MTATAPKFYVESVRGQYEILPYPARDPKKELDVLYSGDCFSLDGLNHVGFSGRRDFRKGARILVAGEGTGDVPVYIAEQLKDGENIEIVAIDLSSASIAIAKERLQMRGLSHMVTHHHLSILDLPHANLGQFDVIECSGVLHHLERPEDGLAALASVLKPDGVMTIMVYALYGRLAIYMVQVLMQFLLSSDTHPQTKLDVAMAFVNALPPGHWLGLMGTRYKAEIAEPTGSGCYDLFLHSTDRAYTVPQIYDWVDEAGLVFGGFCSEWGGAATYQPESYTDSPLLQAICADKSERERQAIAELMCGSIRKHYFYASHHLLPRATFAEDMVICLSFRHMMHADWVANTQKELANLPEGNILRQLADCEGSAPLSLTRNRFTIPLLGLLGQNLTIGAMIDTVAKDHRAPREEVVADCERLYAELHRCQRVWLRHESIAPYPTGLEILQDQLKRRTVYLESQKE